MTDAVAESLLKLLDSRDILSSLEAAQLLGEDHQRIVGAIKSLENVPNMIQAVQVESKRWELTKEGQEIAANGSHEALVFAAVPEAGIEQPLLMKSFSNANVGKLGFSKAMSNGWVVIDKSGGKPVVKRKVPTIEDQVKQLTVAIKNLKFDDVPEKERADLKKRKLISEVVVKSYEIKKGSEFKLEISKPEADLTADMLAKGTWREKHFKEYNFNALGSLGDIGHLHPLLKTRHEFRQIFLEMGFEEMPTNNFVESSFWNFDALFVPQQHPARDDHDTFFISEPAQAGLPPNEYLENVKKVHSKGGYGSTGYRYDWKLDEALKNTLRTHTTAVSARMLYRCAKRFQKDGHFTPVKYFSIDRVFRNETLDATHLAEFHQIEGVVADVGLTLGNLMGVIHTFFKKMGIPDIKFKPAYNPYTEPSMEIFGYHPGLKKWVEVGNSGVFRPELLLPMGLPENVSVIAWGLSLERPTMIKYKIDNIRDLVGHKVDLQMVYDSPICLLNTEEEQIH